MTRTAILLLCLAAVLVLTLPAFAGEEAADDVDRLLAEWEKLTPEQRREKFRLYDQRWKKLPEAERERRLKIFREKLRDLSPEERAELLRTLEALKRRNDLEELRRKHGHMLRAVQGILKAGPPDLRERFGALPPEHKDALRRFMMGRLVEVSRELMLALLSEEERARLQSVPGPRRRGVVRGLVLEKALASLSDEERSAYEALPEREKRRKAEELVDRLAGGRSREARARVAREVSGLLTGDDPRELEKRLQVLWLRRTMRSLGISDRELLRLVSRLPRPEQRTVLHRIREAGGPEERRATADRIKAELTR